jgi:hypothetical protein
MQGGACEVGDGGFQGIEAVVQWQQRLLAEGDDDRLLFAGEHRGSGLLGSHGRIGDDGALAPFCDGFQVKAIKLAQFFERTSDRCIAARMACVVVALPWSICPITSPKRNACRGIPKSQKY